MGYCHILVVLYVDILAELEDKKKYIAIMDDFLIHSTKVAHWKLLEQLLKSVCKNELRLSPKKC